MKREDGNETKSEKKTSTREGNKKKKARCREEDSEEKSCIMKFEKKINRNQNEIRKILT